MPNPAFTPDRGDIVWISLDPQAGRRPALVLSPAVYNGKTGLAIFCLITSRIKGYPFEVIVPDGLSVSGAILSDQAKSLDWRIRQAEWACSVAEETIETVLEKLATLLT